MYPPPGSRSADNDPQRSLGLQAVGSLVRLVGLLVGLAGWLMSWLGCLVHYVSLEFRVMVFLEVLIRIALSPQGVA